MEGGRDDVTGAAPQERHCGRRGRGGGRGSGDESNGSSSGVELSLRLRTGSSPPAAQQQEAAARRSMTIFYDGWVCAVDVTEIRAREIISMANQEILASQQKQQQHREDRHVQDRGSTSTAARCGGQVTRPGAAALSPAGGCPQQGLATMAAPVMTDQARLSMERFLQKRVARRAAAVAPPYAAGDDTDLVVGC